MARRKKPFWYRQSGISKARRKFARETGIPTTRAGRQRKMGRMAGCSVILLAVVAGTGATVAAFLIL